MTPAGARRDDIDERRRRCAPTQCPDIGKRPRAQAWRVSSDSCRVTHQLPDYPPPRTPEDARLIPMIALNERFTMLNGA
ncbi:hypothetical protein FIBSPDRAFT_348226 [Athelia psychrophila]|uniref:Uncharacterized protein n=1 Tax=Athelia psychrophila TaxID=1759441 RepID=A0A167W1D5_9AGAM|nr:hypothetical protein FIBSPDRAFT_348226 [Fibularhizoctonia sp. CBS 109695]